MSGYLLGAMVLSLMCTGMLLNILAARIMFFIILYGSFMVLPFSFFRQERRTGKKKFHIYNQFSQRLNVRLWFNLGGSIRTW
jgi:hypothetical protein